MAGGEFDRLELVVSISSGVAKWRDSALCALESTLTAKCPDCRKLSSDGAVRRRLHHRHQWRIERDRRERVGGQAFVFGVRGPGW